MKKHLRQINKRLVAGILVAVAVVGVSALTIPTPSQNTTARSLNSLQTDKTTLFYAGFQPSATIFVEQVLPESESKAATENLKRVAAAL